MAKDTGEYAITISRSTLETLVKAAREMLVQLQNAQSLDGRKRSERAELESAIESIVSEAKDDGYDERPLHKYRVPVKWECTGYLDIVARSEEEALKKIDDGDVDMDYVDCDDEGCREYDRYNVDDCGPTDEEED